MLKLEDMQCLNNILCCILSGVLFGRGRESDGGSEELWESLVLGLSVWRHHWSGRHSDPNRDVRHGME